MAAQVYTDLSHRANGQRIHATRFGTRTRYFEAIASQTTEGRSAIWLRSELCVQRNSTRHLVTVPR